MTEAACGHLRERASILVEGYTSDHPPSVFTTDESRRTTDAYFLASGREISFFLEEDLTPEASVSLPLSQRCNKIGHALHDLDPVFSAFSRQAALETLARQIGMLAPLLLQSMYIFKGPHVGGEVHWHQDACFLYTEPLSVTGFWFALEDANRDNGCLWVVPGGHRQGLKRRFIRTPEDETRFVTMDSRSLDVSGAIPLEVAAGTLVVIDGCLPHYSAANRSGSSRAKSSRRPASILLEPAWPSSSWVPDLAIVNLGTNDFSTQPNPTAEQFHDGYLAFSKRLKSLFPGAKQLFMSGPMWCCRAPACCQSQG